MNCGAAAPRDAVWYEKKSEAVSIVRSIRLFFAYVCVISLKKKWGAKMMIRVTAEVIGPEEMKSVTHTIHVPDEQSSLVTTVGLIQQWLQKQYPDSVIHTKLLVGKQHPTRSFYLVPSSLTGRLLYIIQ